MRTVDVLGQQHQEVLAYLAQVESHLEQGSGPDAAAFLRFLEQDVQRHFALEEAALFPALERHLGSAHGPLAVMLLEHADFRSLLAALSDAVQAANLDHQRAHARSLVDLLRAHIAKEDQVLFPMAGRVLSPNEQADVDAQSAPLLPA
jgi:hemerythrin-like domain-containing protein